MNRAMRSIAVFALVTFAGASFASAETLEDVKKKIHDKVSKYKSLQFKSKGWTNMSNAQMTSKSDIEMTYEAVRKGDKALSRMEGKTKMEMKAGEFEQKTNTASLVIMDGETMYTLSDTDGQKTAMKSKVEKEQKLGPFDPMTQFKEQEKHMELKLLSDAKVDGKDTYAIEATHKDPSMRQYSGKSVTYYDKDTGIAIKTVTHDGEGKETGQFVTTDIKIDKDISEDRFVFKAPPGVEVQDMPSMPDMGG